MAESNICGPKLQEIFDDIWNLYIFVDTCEEPLADDKVQDRIYVGVKKCEAAVSMINQLSLFSDNETLEEIATNEIKYMLLPALLGFFTIQTTRAERLPCVKKAKTFYTDYVRLCKNYEVTDISLPSPDDESDEERVVAFLSMSRGMDMSAMASTRQAKIEQFRNKKAMESKMKEIHDLMEKGQVDDEVQREYYVMQLKLWISRSMEDIDSIQSEIPILEHMARMKAEKKRHPDHDDRRIDNQVKAPAKKFRPFILTKDVLQKNVLGAGYPSLPTYTIDEFYQQKVDDGTFSLPTAAMGSMSLQDQDANPEAAVQEEEAYLASEERKVEVDDGTELQKKRAMDDWKDDHRRGWGNRQNRL